MFNLIVNEATNKIQRIMFGVNIRLKLEIVVKTFLKKDFDKRLLIIQFSKNVLF